MRIAIVTGASSGIGRAFVRQIEPFYKELDEIWVIARRRERLEELKSLMMSKVRIISGSLLEPDFMSEIEERLKELKPDVRMLVNAAGFGKIGKAMELKKEEQLPMIDLNCRALSEMMLICIPYMSRGSRILNVASGAAFCPQPGFALYAATKSYVVSFSRAMNEELEEQGILVMAVCPGPVETEFFDVAGTNNTHLKEACMVKPEKVVHQALLDSKRGKTVSVCGAPMKSAEAAAKVLPHSVVLKAMKKIWR